MLRKISIASEGEFLSSSPTNRRLICQGYKGFKIQKQEQDLVPERDIVTCNVMLRNKYILGIQNCSNT